jgi:DHA1 family bicyclomycin/chloramphenicol resistance-like MFS transporter
VLVACTGVSILSTDLYTPSLPHLPELLGSDAETVQLTMSLNLAAYAVSQLAHGPLADRYGRRFLLLVGMVGFLVASLGCALAQGIGGLIAGRVAQGLFSSVSSVVVVIMIRELYAGHRAVKVMGFYGMAVGLVPAVGPLIGGYVFVLAGWRMNFLLLVGIAAAVFLLVWRLLPETGTRDRDALRPRRIARGYLGLLALPVYWRYLLPLATLFGAMFAFITAGPFLLIERLGVATEDYGLWYGVMVLAFIAGSLLANRLAERISPDGLVRLGLIASCGGGFAFLPFVLFGAVSPVSLIACVSLLAFGLGLLFASGPFCIFDALGERPRGPASALLSALQLAAASLGSLSVGLFYDGTALPLAGTMAVLAALGGLGYLALGRATRR